MATLLDTRPAGPAAARRRWRAVPGRHPRLLTAAVLLLAAFAIRAAEFGNPLIAVDENFYLLVGDRMLHGALPYVDIWDRKPIGIFLLYAAIRLLGGGGILQYQVVATLFAGATAYQVARIAERMAAWPAAIASGILYLLLIGLAGGLGGQTPVFYNLLVAGAARLTLAAVLDDARPVARVRADALVAMLLLGLAIQIKYTVVFEGAFFGLVTLRELWRRTQSPAAVARDALAMIAVALAPTAMALAAYLALGHAPEFIYANVVSIFARSGEPAHRLLSRLGHTWMVLHLPLFGVLLSALLAPWRRFPDGPRAFAFTAAWLGAAVAGYLVFGSYFDHYALPLMVPIAIGCAPLFSHRPHRLGAVAAALLLLAGTLANAVTIANNKRHKGDARAFAAMVDVIRPRLGGGCLYVMRGESLLYYAVPSCIPTRFAFPEHLTLAREAPAIGVDPLAEMRRVFATRPSVVVDTSNRDDVTLNPAAMALGRGILRRDYRPVATLRLPDRTTTIFQRR
jgi:hypothetical protein